MTAFRELAVAVGLLFAGEVVFFVQNTFFGVEDLALSAATAIWWAGRAAMIIWLAAAFFNGLKGAPIVKAVGMAAAIAAALVAVTGRRSGVAPEYWIALVFAVLDIGFLALAVLGAARVAQSAGAEIPAVFWSAVGLGLYGVTDTIYVLKLLFGTEMVLHYYLETGYFGAYLAVAYGAFRTVATSRGLADAARSG
ncbi:MAG: hypothetical protein M5R36_04330 [Deltaproteobacteria bacterium]|nr:hypothetical protein [Deltaproteobacteria bacterium]